MLPQWYKFREIDALMIIFHWTFQSSTHPTPIFQSSHISNIPKLTSPNSKIFSTFLLHILIAYPSNFGHLSRQFTKGRWNLYYKNIEFEHNEVKLDNHQRIKYLVCTSFTFYNDQIIPQFVHHCGNT